MSATVKKKKPTRHLPITIGLDEVLKEEMKKDPEFKKRLDEAARKLKKSAKWKKYVASQGK